MLGAVLPAAPDGQPAAFVPVVIDLQHRNRFSHHKGVGGQTNLVFHDLPEGPELLVVAVGVDHDVLDQIVQFRFALLTTCHP